MRRNGKISESLLQTMVDSAADAILLADSGATFVYANEKACRLLGYTRDELLKMAVSDIDPNYPKESWAKTWYYIKQRKNFIFETAQRRKDGKTFPVEINVNYLKIEGKEYAYASVRDISERKHFADMLQKSRENLEIRVQKRTSELARINVELQQEIELHKKAEAAITELEKQIEFILAATRTGLDIIDSDYNLVYVDPGWAKIYGNYEGKKCFEYFMSVAEPCRGCGIRKALDTKQIIVTEEILVRENNRPIQVTTIPFQNASGKWLVAEVNVDISEIKKKERLATESQRRYSELVNNLNVGVYRNIPGEGGVFLEVNSKMVDIFEADSKEQLMDCKIKDLYYHPQDRLKFSNKLLRLGAVYNEKVELVTLRGRRFLAAITATKEINAEGNICFVGIIEDFTPSKRIKNNS